MAKFIYPIAWITYVKWVLLLLLLLFAQWETEV